MGFNGLIYVAIAVAWLVYLVPQFLHRDEHGLVEVAEPAEPITETVTIVRRGVPLDAEDEAQVLVSTPLNRRALLHELDRADEQAATRRRIVLGVLLGALTLLGVLAGVGQVAWWSLAIPGVLLGAFVGVARVTVVRMRADLDARAARIRATGQTEQTVAIRVLRESEDAVNEQVIDLTAPVQAVTSLLDPIPITKPTYVSKPLAPRTVRTIDLSAPVAGSAGIPVTADAPEPPAAEDAGERAVNE